MTRVPRQTSLGLTVLIAVVLSLVWRTTIFAQEFGHFPSQPHLRGIDNDDKQMKLLEDFSYVDRHGISWTAPAGTITDGASIPRALWTIAGAPFTGPQRDPAIIHDHYCVARNVDSERVHETFYYGLLARGMRPGLAKLFYWGVLHGGPRWKVQHGISGETEIISLPTRSLTEEQIRKAKSQIESEDPDPEELLSMPPTAK